MLAGGKLQGLEGPIRVAWGGATGVESSPNPGRDVHEDPMELWEAGMGSGKALGALRVVVVSSRPCLHNL